MIFPGSEDQGRELIYLLFSKCTFPHSNTTPLAPPTDGRSHLNLIILPLISSVFDRAQFSVLAALLKRCISIAELFVAVSCVTGVSVFFFHRFPSFNADRRAFKKNCNNMPGNLIAASSLRRIHTAPVRITSLPSTFSSTFSFLSNSSSPLPPLVSLLI